MFRNHAYTEWYERKMVHAKHDKKSRSEREKYEEEKKIQVRNKLLIF